MFLFHSMSISYCFCLCSAWSYILLFRFLCRLRSDTVELKHLKLRAVFTKLSFILPLSQIKDCLCRNLFLCSTFRKRKLFAFLPIKSLIFVWEHTHNGHLLCTSTPFRNIRYIKMYWFQEDYNLLGKTCQVSYFYGFVSLTRPMISLRVERPCLILDFPITWHVVDGHYMSD